MSKRKIAHRRQASRRIYYHLALRDTEVRTVRRAVPNIHPTGESEKASAALVRA